MSYENNKRRVSDKHLLRIRAGGIGAVKLISAWPLTQAITVCDNLHVVRGDVHVLRDICMLYVIMYMPYVII